MKAADVKPGMKVVIDSEDFVNEAYNGHTGVVREIIDDPKLRGMNITVQLDKGQEGRSKGQKGILVVSAACITLIKE